MKDIAAFSYIVLKFKLLYDIIYPNVENVF